MATRAKQTAPADLMGKVVKDQISNFKGTVTGVVWFLSGSIQAHVAPPCGKDGKMPEGWSFDVDRLTILKAGPVKATPPDDTSIVALGATATDRVTGLEGTVTEKCVYLNGCTHVVLTARTAKKEVRIIAVDWKRLDLMSTAPVMTAPPATMPPKGGPSRRIEQYG